ADGAAQGRLCLSLPLDSTHAVPRTGSCWVMGLACIRVGPIVGTAACGLPASGASAVDAERVADPLQPGRFGIAAGIDHVEAAGRLRELRMPRQEQPRGTDDPPLL